MPKYFSENAKNAKEQAKETRELRELQMKQQLAARERAINTLHERFIKLDTMIELAANYCK